MSFIIYIFKVSLALAIFALLYRTVLRRLTYFKLNRFYLLGTLTLSFLLPLFAFDLQRIGANLPAGISGIDWGQFDEAAIPMGDPQAYERGLTPAMLLPFAYYLVAAFFLLLSGWKILRMFSFRGGREIGKSGRIRFYINRTGTGSFTVMRRIYLDTRTLAGDPEPVRQHEMIHARQLHSLDLILMEFAIALLWFNPFVFLFRRYMSENHEFLADSHVQKSGVSLEDYLRCLKAETGRMITPAIASHFKSSTLKKRIIMLTHKQSKPVARWFYLLVIPVSAVLLMAFSNPPESGATGITAVPGIELFQVPAISGITVPSKFPLDEKYRSEVTWDFNQKRVHPIYKTLTVHKGMDFRAPNGTAVYATADGTIITAEFHEGYGKLVVIQHGEHFTTLYAHLNEIKVSSGDVVKKGAVIGTVGNTGKSTGDHLHYEVRKDGENVDPKEYF